LFTVGGKSKIGQLDGLALVTDKNVLRLQVAVVNAQTVAVLDGVENLEENLAGKAIVTNVLAALRDVAEKVAFGAVVKDNIYTVGSSMILRMDTTFSWREAS
jgi:hypothetical protein